MRRLITIAGTAVLLSGFTLAQTAGDQGNAGMMSGGNSMTAKGMMGKGMGMMGEGVGMSASPLRSSVFTAFALPEMQTELGLSAQQTTQLRQLKQQMITKGQELSRQVASKQRDLNAAVTSANPNNGDVKQLLEQVAALRAQAQFTAFETAGNMKAALTEQQRTKLAAMKPGDLHQAFMSHTTMADMADVMRFMGADGGMMRRGMMGMMGMMDGGMDQGMMNHGMK